MENYTLDLTGEHLPNKRVFRYTDALHDFSDKKKLGELAYLVLQEQFQIGETFIRTDKSSTGTSKQTSFSTSASPNKLHDLIRNPVSEQEFIITMGDEELVTSKSPEIIGPIKLSDLTAVNINNQSSTLPQLPRTGNFILKLIGPKKDLYEKPDQINEYLKTGNDNFTFSGMDGFYAKDAVALNDRFIKDLAGDKDGKYLLAGLIDPATGSTTQIPNASFEYNIFYTNCYDSENPIPMFPVFAKITSSVGNNNEYKIGFYTNPNQKPSSENIFTINTGSKHSSPSIENISQFVNNNYTSKQKNKSCINFFDSFIKRQTLKVKKLLGGGKDTGFFKMTKEELANIRNIDWTPLFFNLLTNYAHAIRKDMNTITPFQAINCLISLKTNGDQSYYWDSRCFKDKRQFPSAVFSNDQFLIDYILYKKDVGIFNKTILGSNLVVQIYVPEIDVEAMQLLRERTDEINSERLRKKSEIVKNFEQIKVNLKKNFDSNPYDKYFLKIKSQAISRTSATYKIDDQIIWSTIITLFYYSLFKLRICFLYYSSQIKEFDNYKEKIEFISQRTQDKEIPELYINNLESISSIISDFNTEVDGLFSKWDDIRNPSTGYIITDNIVELIKYQFGGLEEIKDYNTFMETFETSINKKIALFASAQSNIANNTLYQKKGLNKYFVPADRFYLKQELIAELYNKFKTQEIDNLLSEIRLPEPIIRPTDGEPQEQNRLLRAEAADRRAQAEDERRAQAEDERRAQAEDERRAREQAQAEAAEAQAQAQADAERRAREQAQAEEEARMAQAQAEAEAAQAQAAEEERRALEQAEAEEEARMAQADAEAQEAEAQGQGPMQGPVQGPVQGPMQGPTQGPAQGQGQGQQVDYGNKRQRTDQIGPFDQGHNDPHRNQRRGRGQMTPMTGGRDINENDLNTYKLLKNESFEILDEYLWGVQILLKTLNEQGTIHDVYTEGYRYHPMDKLYQHIFYIVDTYSYINQLIENTNDPVIQELYNCLNNDILNSIFYENNSAFEFIINNDDYYSCEHFKDGEFIMFKNLQQQQQQQQQNTNPPTDNTDNIYYHPVSPINDDDDFGLSGLFSNSGGKKTKKRKNKPKSYRKNKNKNRKTKRVRNIKTKKSNNKSNNKNSSNKKIIKITPKHKVKSVKKLKTRRRKI